MIVVLYAKNKHAKRISNRELKRISTEYVCKMLLCHGDEYEPVCLCVHDCVNNRKTETYLCVYSCGRMCVSGVCECNSFAKSSSTFLREKSGLLNICTFASTQVFHFFLLNTRKKKTILFMRLNRKKKMISVYVS